MDILAVMSKRKKPGPRPLSDIHGEEMTSLRFVLSATQRKKLIRLAAAEGVSMAAWLRLAIETADVETFGRELPY